jgi:2-polyprenyl-3-methyl-5-hydroxy-6-metoxy-1,4-benzoquinol methylase
MSNNDSELSRWQPVKDLMQHADKVTFGKHISYWFRKSPRRALHSMSYYKFASRMIGDQKSVLDIGCGEGLGTWLLAKECGQATGIDLDSDAIRTASNNWNDETISFVENDFLSIAFPRSFDAVVNFDVIEHIHPDHMPLFLDKVISVLPREGIFIAGTPNSYSQQYASEISKAGHINVYSPEALETQMRQYFRHVFCFSANDEMVHTGYNKLAHYLLVLCCNKK